MGWEERMRTAVRAVWRDDVRLGWDDGVRFGDLREALAELRAARAEIERLRTAAADERAYVVAWLRGMGRGFASHLASEFEQGAHVGAAKGANHG